MALPVGPASLPPLRGTAGTAGSKSLHPPVQETEFDDGPVRTRRRSLFVTTPLNMSVELTADQFVTFKGFHLNTLNAGAKRFSAPVLLPDMTIGARTCRISRAVSWAAPKRFKYVVAFTLIVQDW